MRSLIFFINAFTVETDEETDTENRVLDHHNNMTEFYKYSTDLEALKRNVDSKKKENEKLAGQIPAMRKELQFKTNLYEYNCSAIIEMEKQICNVEKRQQHLERLAVFDCPENSEKLSKVITAILRIHEARQKGNEPVNAFVLLPSIAGKTIFLTSLAALQLRIFWRTNFANTYILLFINMNCTLLTRSGGVQHIGINS